MSESIARIPNGMRYYCNSEAKARREVETIAMSVFAGWSYEEITTPTIDYYSLFNKGIGNTLADKAFKFADADGRILTVRPEVTSGVARAAATLYANRARPLRFSYVASVFRQKQQSHAEWRREITQIGCELIGRNSRVADLEVLLIALEIFRQLELEHDLVITLNNVEILKGIADGLQLDPNSREELRRLVDSRNAQDITAFLQLYTPREDASAFARLVQLSGKEEVFGPAQRIITNPRSLAALDRLQVLWQTIQSLDLAERFEIDLGNVSQLDYYTGLTFTIYVRGAGAALGSGGRYDDLLANFGKSEPAIGFVLNLDALSDLLSARSNRVVEARRQTWETISSVDRDSLELFREALRKREIGKCIRIDMNEVGTCAN